MACKLKPIKADPFPVSDNLSCHACGQNSRKRPTTIVILTDKQLQKRANVDTSPLPNPFVELPGKSILLCSDCRSSSHGWGVISDPRRYGAKSRSALQSWKQRTSPRQIRKTLECYICKCLKPMHKQTSAPSPNLSKRNLPLMQLFLYTRESQESFCFDLSRRSGISISDARLLLCKLPEARFCYLHHNQTRHSKKFASGLEPTKRGERHGFCIFRNNGCLQTSFVLRPLPKPRLQSLEDVESYSDFEDAVMSHSSRALTPGEVIGKQACGTCRYILTKGSSGTKPLVDTAILKCATDRCLVDCILFALDKKAETDMDSVYMRANDEVKMEALKLKEKVVTPLPDVPNACCLPIAEVQKLRTLLHSKSSQGSNNVCGKTVESRIAPVLAARRIYCYSLSRKFRCYATPQAISKTFNSFMHLSTMDEVLLRRKERGRMLTQLSQRYLRRGDEYRRGSWFLSEEICAVPEKLWASVIMDMASNKQIASWKVACTASEIPLQKLFPVCNEREHFPVAEMDNFPAFLRVPALRDVPFQELIICYAFEFLNYWNKWCTRVLVLVLDL